MSKQEDPRAYSIFVRGRPIIQTVTKENFLQQYLDQLAKLGDRPSWKQIQFVEDGRVQMAFHPGDIQGVIEGVQAAPSVQGEGQ